MERKGNKNDQLPGSLDMLILKTLTRGAAHGYAISQRIEQASDEELLIEEGSLYPALQRLEMRTGRCGRSNARSASFAAWR